MEELRHWINFEAIRALTHHASGVIVAVLVFALVGRLVLYLVPDSLFKHAVIIVDDVVLVLLMIWFGYQLFVYLWNHRQQIGAATPAASVRLVSSTARHGLGAFSASFAPAPPSG